MIGCDILELDITECWKRANYYVSAIYNIKKIIKRVAFVEFIERPET